MSIAIGTLAMLVGNVGLQVLNNWCNSRQNNELQLKREEFERAARNHQTERMWQILREGQAITLELEQSRQKQRIEELESEMEKLLKSLAYQKTIENWPLSVLPIVMKNQALGNLLAHQNESFAMHCILTPSNNPSFNKHVFPYVEQSLENYCNQYWSIDGSHPVLFYGGAWASNDAPTQTQISSMQAALSNLPTMLITPFFRPGEGRLIFQVRMWGIGATSDNKDFEDTWEIEPTDFQHEYSVCSDYDKEEHLLDDAINDIVPYLQCLIGYMADTYFWSSNGLAPHLPLLIVNGNISSNRIENLVFNCREYYDNLLLTCSKNAQVNPFGHNNLMVLYEGCSVLWKVEEKKINLEKIFIQYCSAISLHEYSSMEEIIKKHCFSQIDLPVIDSYLLLCKNPEHIDALIRIKDEIILSQTDISDNDTLLNEYKADTLFPLAEQGNPIANFRLGELYEYSIGVDYNPEESERYYVQSERNGFPLALIRRKIKNNKGEDITLTEIEYLEKNHSIQSTLYKAECMYKGYGMAKSVENAMNELEQISEATHPYIYYLSAQIVKEEYGEEQGELLVELLLKAANSGYVQAQLDLMNVYNEGRYVAENPYLCVEFAKKAALQGHPEALLTLAICSLKGYGVAANKAKAIELLKMAANRGNNDAVDILNAITR